MLFLAVVLAERIGAGESVSATILMSVYLEPVEEAASESAAGDSCSTPAGSSDSVCQTSLAEYSIDKENGYTRLTVRPIVHVTVKPI